MAALNTLTPDELETLNAYIPAFRGSVVALVKALNTLTDLDSVWNSIVKAINDKLDVGLVVPDSTGLAGAQTLSTTDLINFMTALETMLATNNSASWRTAYVRCVGLRMQCSQRDAP